MQIAPPRLSGAIPMSLTPPDATVELAIRRLHDGGWERFAGAWIDHLLARPIADLIDPGWIADLSVALLEASVDNPQTEAWIRARVTALRERVPTGALRAAVPADVVRPLSALLRRPYAPDEALVRRLLRHDAVERLLKDTLMSALQGFARRLRPPAGFPQGPFGPGLGKLRDSFGAGMREGLLGGLSHELERQAEQKAREFVDSALQSVMDEVATHLCDPAHAPRYGAYRAYLLDTLLDTPLNTLAREGDKLDLDEVVKTTQAIGRALVRRTELKGEIRRGVALLAREAGQMTAGEAMAESGIAESAWRPSAEAMLVREARAFSATPAFQAWLTTLLTP